MLLTSAGPEGPIPPETRRVAALLAREKTGEILAHLFRTPYLSASEIARLEAIHVATAQRYLKELTDAGLLGCRVRDASTRPTEEYWLLEPNITIQIRLDGDEAPGMADAARRIAVRDLGPTNVIYDTNPRTGDVEGILVLSDAQPRLVAERIRLSAAVGRFLAHLPYTAGQVQSVWEIMRRAGLGEDHLPEILSAIDRFTAPDPSPATAPPPEGEPIETGSRSARPLDPQLQALFRSLGARHAPGGPTPSVPILELSAIDPSSLPEHTDADHPSRRPARVGGVAPEPTP